MTDSVVLVQVYRSRFDWSLPWRQEAVESSLGSGFLIAGGRVVTNAHVVADAKQVLVRRHDQANPYLATVKTVADDCGSLVPPPAIGHNAGGQSRDGGHTLVEAVEYAELERRQLEMEEQVDREHARHHLGRDVGEATHQTERPDRWRDPMPNGAGPGRGLENRGVEGIHVWACW